MSLRAFAAVCTRPVLRASQRRACACRAFSSAGDQRGSGDSSAPAPENVSQTDHPTENPWDELFAGPDAYPMTHAVGDQPAGMSEPMHESSAMLRSALHAGERTMGPPRGGGAPLQRARHGYEARKLTRSETQQFQRIFALLDAETGAQAPADEPPEFRGFATRNALQKPGRVMGRGGGVGTRFHAPSEGPPTNVSAADMDVAVDQIWAALQAQPHAYAAWQWAEAHLWGGGAPRDTRVDDAQVADGPTPRAMQPPPYSVDTPFYAPALHMLVLTLRDRFHAPHTALAVVDRARELGANSFVLGCTASLYAEIVRTQWLCLRDAYGVLETVREARRASILQDADDTLVHDQREDRALRAQIERVRNDIRNDVMQRAQGAAAAAGDAAAAPSLVPPAADEDLLRVVDELRRIAGHTSRYDEPPRARRGGQGTARRMAADTGANRARRVESAAKHRVREARESASGVRPPVIVPTDPYALLRTRVHRKEQRETERA
ncbi:hypothetical protein MSPP1_002054 [Malassezia sp. CBS 17886]|nr:hypothetical protein MSPP1_002054 [Malassezia sp. CBS 17886]